MLSNDASEAIDDNFVILAVHTRRMSAQYRATRL